MKTLFEPYGKVQTVILNHDKRMAFVKLYTRLEAEKARQGMMAVPYADTTLRVSDLNLLRRLTC